MQRAYVMVAMGVDKDLSLKAKSIVIYGTRVAAIGPSELFFEWFSVTGWSYAKAYENAVAAIVFYVKCRPAVREAVLKTCCPTLRDEVLKALE